MSKKQRKVPEESGVYVYIGPSIFGVIQKGTIYHGKLSDIKRKLAFAIEKHPQITRLIVKSSEVAEARNKLKSASSLSIAYKELSNN